MPSKNLERLNLYSVDKKTALNIGIREKFKINSDWRFSPGEREEECPVTPAFNDDSWEQIHLPHDFVIGKQLGSVLEVDQDFQRNSGWYRKTFEIPNSDKGKNLWIDFDGIYGKSTFWFNGRPLGSCLSCYAGTHFDITDLVHYGEINNITIYVDAHSDGGQKCESGGIYRHVWLNKSDYLRVAPQGIFVISTIPDGETTPIEAEIEIRTKILNGFQNALSFTILSEIQDAQGNAVLSFSYSHTVGIDTFTEVVQKVRLRDPILWSLKSPHLYSLITQLVREGEIVDGVTTPFGIRSIRFDECRGFFLNGQSVKIKGTCNCEDFAGVGIAIPDRIISYKLEKLIEVGSNAYRPFQHPPSIEFLNECDRLGMLVIDGQSRLGGLEEDISQLENLVMRDRNHPCIILWSLCHENPRQETEKIRQSGEVMRDMVLKHDSTRPITCATNIEDSTGLTKVIDIQGIDENASQYDTFHSSHPNIPVYGSKIANAVSTRGIYDNDLEKGYLTVCEVNGSKLVNESEPGWNAVTKRPFVFGGFIWTGFDYGGESILLKKRGNGQSGFMDICGFPKDTYYYFQSWWSDKRILHLFPHWNWQAKEGQEIEVRCYSNCESVELLLNEKSQGIQKMPSNGHLEWKVKYHPGSLRAIGTESGKVMIETTVETASAPVKVRLKPYRLEMIVDGEDTIPIEVEILDWKNRLVPLAYNEVVFSVKGPGKIVGVGNGDPASSELDKSDKRKAFNGRCMVLIRATEKPGEIRIMAKSPGLRHGSVILKSF